MKIYKVIQHFIRKNDNQEIDYDFNYIWTPSKERLNKDVLEIEGNIKYNTEFNDHMAVTYRNPPYTIIEKEAEGFTLEGKVSSEYNYEGVTCTIGEADIIGRLHGELNGVKVRVLVEVME